jgi:glycosyltransferase involved in cell wall biosynthesis
MCEAYNVFHGKLGVQQRVLPGYRAPFFEALAGACEGGLSVFAGAPLPVEAIVTAEHLQQAHLFPAVNRHRADPSSPFYFCIQDNLLTWLKAWQPDALILEANPRYLGISAAIRWMRQRQRPVLGWGLGAPFNRPALALVMNPLWGRFLRQFDGLLAYSQRGAEQYRARGVPAERVFVAPNAAVARPAHPPAPRPLTFDSSPCVLFVGRLQARKRLDNLLNACAALSTEIQPRLVVVGDGPERPALEALAASIYPRTEFVGAHSGAALVPFYAAADLFALPGTGGLAVQQAMAHGLPVLVARGDGTQDDLVRSENGWQIPPDNLPALTDTLALALSDVSRLRAMGAESYRIVAEEVNLERMVRVFVEAVGKVKS